MRPGGFTLIEMLAVVLLTALVLTASVNFYIDLTRQSTLAAELTRDARHAVALLDRVARDLEGSTLVEKPKEMDPLEHPWLFLAESSGGDAGAERLKFVTRSHEPRSDEPGETDLQVVTWSAAPGDAGDLVLRRSAANGLPEGLDRSFPDEQDEVVVARGIARFGVRLLDETGEWKTSWDSSTLVDSSKLPLAAEIEVAFLPPEEALASDAEAPTPYVRRVALPLRPIDLEGMLHPEAADGEDAKDGEEDEEEEADDAGALTVSECLAKSPALVAALGDLDPSVLESLAGQPAASVAASHGVALPPECQ
jgi:prepilin-type N-terminal cleavage/methylation domain-containing protein